MISAHPHKWGGLPAEGGNEIPVREDVGSQGKPMGKVANQVAPKMGAVHCEYQPTLCSTQESSQEDLASLPRLCRMMLL